MMSNRLRILPPLLFLTLLVQIILLSACGKEKERLYPYGWTRTDPGFDSLTMRLESAYNNIAPDSVLESLTAEMSSLAGRATTFPEQKARYHYWHARLRLRHGDIEDALEEFRAAIALTDSARHPYDVARIRWNMELDEPYDPDAYFAALRKVELFKKFNDLPMQAAYYMTLGGIMNDIGNPGPAINYFTSADSLLRLAGLYGQLSRNVLNRSKSYERAGKYKEAESLLRLALEDSLFCQEPVAVNIAQWNLYLLTDSLPLLLKAYDGLEGDLQEREMRPLYGSFLIREYAKRGMMDSLRAIIPIVERDTALLWREDYRRDYFIARAEAAITMGDYKKAADCYASAVEMMYAISKEETAIFISDAETRRLIDEAVYNEELKRKDRTVVFLIVVVVCLLAMGGIALAYRHRYIKQMKEKAEASLRHEQSQRKVLALEIAMEENRRLSQDLRDALGSLAKEGLVTPAVTGALDATLRTHDISRPAQESFVEAFAEINPQFLELLDRKYPGLSKSERRLAAYIALGLDNKHIARLIGVRPESVKQARWRLRTKLGLAEGSSLDETLRNLTAEPQ